MCKFDYMVFTGGNTEEFVVHAKKYTKEQTIDLMLSEMDYLSMNDNETSEYRLPSIVDIDERYIRYYIKVPDFCDYDRDGGCYTYCNKDSKGCFPVYVISLEKLLK